MIINVSHITFITNGHSSSHFFRCFFNIVINTITWMVYRDIIELYTFWCSNIPTILWSYFSFHPFYLISHLPWHPLPLCAGSYYQGLFALDVFLFLYIYNLCTLVLDYGLVHSKDFVIIQVENWTVISIISGYTIVAVLWLFEFFSTQTWFQSKSSLSSSKLSHLFLSVWAENLRLCSSRIFNEEH